jgi:hypothetical protein
MPTYTEDFSSEFSCCSTGPDNEVDYSIEYDVTILRCCTLYRPPEIHSEQT